MKCISGYYTYSKSFSRFQWKAQHLINQYKHTITRHKIVLNIIKDYLNCSQQEFLMILNFQYCLGTICWEKLKMEINRLFLSITRICCIGLITLNKPKALSFEKNEILIQLRILKASYNAKQVRPNDVWTCVACSYFIYKKLT